MTTITLPQSPHSSGVVVGPINGKYVFSCRCGYVRLIGPAKITRAWLCEPCSRHMRDRDKGRHCWRSIISRCTKPRAKGYDKYGAKGIGVCDDWITGRDGMTGFQTFISDMGPRPSRGHTVHRENNDDGYTPANCRWATDSEQQNARTNNRFFRINGETKTLSQWAAQFGMRASVVYSRVVINGWPIDIALTTPVRNKKS